MKEFYVTKIDIYNDKVVLMRFNDGTYEKAVCSDNDTFDLDVGLTICIIKRMLGGTKAYNDIMRSLRLMIEKQAEDKAKNEEARKKRREKDERRQEKARKKKEARLQEINEMLKAIVNHL